MLPLDAIQKFLVNPEENKKSVPGLFFYIGMTVFFYGVWYLLFKRIFHKDLR